MRAFSIRELERISGVRAHTVRTWEQRFGLLEPGRSKGNIRSYTLADILTLMDVCLLLENGHKISRLAALTTDERDTRLAAIKTADARQKKSLRKLIGYMYTNDIQALENEMDDSVLAFGIHVTIGHIVIPFLEKIDLTSYHDNTIETHFAVTAIRKKIILGIETITTASTRNRSVLLFLPEHEHYDLLLLYMYYILKRNGMTIYYLGTNITTGNLRKAIAEKTPDHLCCYIANKKNLPILNELGSILLGSPALAVHIAYADDTLKGMLQQSAIAHSRYDMLFETLLDG